VISSESFTKRVYVAGTWVEIITVLVEGHCHHSIGKEEGLFYAVTMMDINIHIKNPRKPS
jgi:hypothetical protein